MHAHQEFGQDDGRESYGLPTGEGSGTYFSPLHCDERTRIDYEAHGSSAGWSAAVTSSRSLAKPTSGGPSAAHAWRISPREAVGQALGRRNSNWGTPGPGRTRSLQRSDFSPIFGIVFGFSSVSDPPVPDGWDAAHEAGWRGGCSDAWVESGAGGLVSSSGPIWLWQSPARAHKVFPPT